MAGWHHWFNGRESQWTPGFGDGQGGLACCDSWGRKESDTTERLNWTELTEGECPSTVECINYIQSYQEKWFKSIKQMNYSNMKKKSNKIMHVHWMILPEWSWKICETGYRKPGGKTPQKSKNPKVGTTIPFGVQEKVVSGRGGLGVSKMPTGCSSFIGIVP